MIKPNQSSEDCTVKASNCGPHGIFEPFLASSVASFDEYVPKRNRTKFADLKIFYSSHLIHFFCRTR
jgi:hypothetical protein